MFAAPPVFVEEPGAGGATDTTPPVVAITSVSAGDRVPAGIVLRADATDDVAVARVRFLVDGGQIGNDVLIAPYWVSWDTAGVTEGAHTVTVTAFDFFGNAASAEVAVTVDRTPPAVALAPVLDGATISDTLTIAATASDNFDVAGVSFSVNGVVLSDDTSPPYAIEWDTTLVADGAYTIQAAARDLAGNLNSTSTSLTVLNGTMRLEEDDPAIGYSGTWLHGNTARSWSAGTAAIAVLTAFAAQATLSFDGTGVSWLGFRGPQAGIARVYVDGIQVATVDLYDTVEQVSAVTYRVNGLQSGRHTLVIEATGTRNPQSTDPFVVVDAFIVFSH